MHIVYDSPPRRVVAHRLSEADFFGVSGLFGKPNIGKHQNSTARRPGSNSPAARMPPNTRGRACLPVRKDAASVVGNIGICPRLIGGAVAGNADATVEAVKGGAMHYHSNGKFQIRRLTIPPQYLSCASTPAQTNKSANQTSIADFIMMSFGCALFAKNA